jgi:hypothetical protein
MKKRLITVSLAIFSLAACTKSVDNVINGVPVKSVIAAITDSSQFIKYTILKGQQYCDKRTYQAVKYDQLSFTVKFDSSAIYKTTDLKNQNDINKLFGFSDNNAAHHEFSARFGWRWSNNALHLFGYIYNNSVMSNRELGTVTIGSENNCTIKVSDSTYIFTVNNKSVTMPRASKTLKAEGYKLYPYFGGDEMAPHTISIWIKEL